MRRSIERGIVGEDPLLELPKLGAGLDSELFDEASSSLDVALECIGLAP